MFGTKSWLLPFVFKSYKPQMDLFVNVKMVTESIKPCRVLPAALVDNKINIDCHLIVLI